MILLIILLVLAILWLIGFLIVNDLAVPTKDITSFKNVLLIFPHPDDEILSCGGLVQKLISQGSQVSLLVLTKGEKGTPNGQLDPSLKDRRTIEMRQVADLLHLNLIHEDFGDGNLVNCQSELKSLLATQLSNLKPDLVITYDQSGLYGHPDHIVVSQLITTLTKTTLWYATIPRRLFKLAHLPEHMAQDKNCFTYRTYPSLKVFVGSGILNKIKGVYLHHSQYLSFRNSVPKFLPLPVLYSFFVYEYFYAQS